MKKVKVSGLPKKEKQAHNMIRIPAWIFGGLCLFNGIMSGIVFILNRYFIENFTNDLELVKMQAILEPVYDNLVWALFFSLFIGACLLLVGFLYQNFIKKGKILMIGLGVVIIIGVILYYFSLMDFYVQLENIMASEMDMIDVNIFSKIMNIASLVGIFIGLVYYLIPIILAYIGFNKLEKIQNEKELELND
jgi:hypothetical protein